MKAREDCYHYKITTYKEKEDQYYKYDGNEVRIEDLTTKYNKQYNSFNEKTKKTLCEYIKIIFKEEEKLTGSFNVKDLFAALIECGYADTRKKPSYGYLTAKINLALSIINNNSTIDTNFNHTESTEKVFISNLLGFYFCYIGIKEIFGEIKSFYHLTLFRDKLSPALSTKEKHADFLVENNSGEWYFIEAKGSSSGGLRYEAILYGLDQANTSAKKYSITTPKSTTISAKGYYLIYTKIEPGKEIHVHAYDPPTSHEHQKSIDVRILMEEKKKNTEKLLQSIKKNNRERDVWASSIIVGGARLFIRHPNYKEIKKDDVAQIMQFQKSTVITSDGIIIHEFKDDATFKSITKLLRRLQ